MPEAGMVIVGAGEAGVRAALELRSQGWTGPITLIAEETWAPYERPPLSKDLLVSQTKLEPIFIANEQKLSAENITFLAGHPAAKIERDTRMVVLANGTRVPFHRLLLATGARPRKLSPDGWDAERLMYLRTFSDTLMLRDRLVSGVHVVIIGGGFIGLETAASAIERGCSVTVIEVAPRILMRGVPKEIADVVEARHKTAGVEFRIGVQIDSIKRSDDKHVITLADGFVLHCDAVIVGIGAIPETSLAAECGLEIENGIRVDQTLRTSDPNIYAAGDCCSFPHVLYNGTRIRLEAWRNAQDQAMLVASNMLGAQEAYATVPWMWSDQYDLTLQVTGLAEFANSMITRKNGEASLFFHLTQDGQLVAASGVGPAASIARDIRLAEMLIQQQARPNPADLENPAVKLKSLLNSQS